MSKRKIWIVALAVLIISTLACSVPGLGSSAEPSAGVPGSGLRYDNGDMNISTYRPNGWEISWYDYDNFDIFEIAGEGYIEIYLFDETTAPEYWEMTFTPGMNKTQLLEDIITELSYVLYDIPYETRPLQSAAGDAICAFGYDENFNEGEFIGVVMQQNQAILVFASDYSRQTFDTNLPIYQGIVESMETLN
ncbi:MAG: hypothetical protein JXJ17_05965 [Anaerolineae bacterium]|nr:hypothetical protein [Anaerolineae bacterium]